jgi:hypothetical protein
VAGGGDLDFSQSQGPARRQVAEPEAPLEVDAPHVDPPGVLSAVGQLEEAFLEAEHADLDVGPSRRLFVRGRGDPDGEVEVPVGVEGEARARLFEKDALDDDAPPEEAADREAGAGPRNRDLRPRPLALAPEGHVPELERPLEKVPANRPRVDRSLEDSPGLADRGSRRRPLHGREVEQAEEEPREAGGDEDASHQRPRGAGDPQAARFLFGFH